MTTWHVWTDGSCQHGLAQVPKRRRGHGGWAAIVEHGSEGIVLRGREPATTSVRMELLAACEGLAVVPAGALCVLHTDATVIAGVAVLLEEDGILEHTGADAQLWRRLARELERRRVEIDLLGRGPRPSQHRLAHGIAGAEARGGLKDLPTNATPYQPSKRDKAAERKQKASQQGVRVGMLRLQHLGGCTNEFCMYTCPVWLARHPQLQGQFRRTA